MTPLAFRQLPKARQLDLFAEHIPHPASLSSWNDGVAPPDIRAATRDFMRQWGLKQAQAAVRVGCSQPQLSNILAGRFGAGPGTAAALKKLLIELMDAA